MKYDPRNIANLTNMKWYYLVSIGVGLLGIVAIVYLILRTTGLLARMSGGKVPAEYEVFE